MGGFRLLMDHPVYGPAPYYTLCKKFFRNERNAPIAKPPKKANCKTCLKEYEKALKHVQKKYKELVEGLRHAV